ncbi:hypothetical protein RND81_08G150700 [Saponaria officinalis]|uniref:Cystic fibrosis transmembrane conductance regulator n=1 Tax=Saponaria officinalis TaxID=3572 RepID=A0AAW1J7K1_SAPOF
MVGIFSKFTSSKTGHRRTQSAIDEREVLPPNAEVAGVDAAPPGGVTVTHGIEVAVEFKPVEHPTEPFDNDTPVQCPLPEPSILNDGRLWKERVSAANVRRRADVPLMKEGSIDDSSRFNRMMLPSLSAPEHNILNFLDECNASASASGL